MTFYLTRWYDDPPERCCDDERDLVLEARWQREAEDRARRNRRQARLLRRVSRYLATITGLRRVRLRQLTG